MSEIRVSRRVDLIRRPGCEDQTRHGRKTIGRDISIAKAQWSAREGGRTASWETGSQGKG